MKKVVIDGVEFHEILNRRGIKEKVKTQAEMLNNKFSKEDNVLCIVVMNGAMFYAADLLKKLDFEPEIISTKVTSYDGFKRQGIAKSCSIDVDVEGRNVIIIEDIVDSGHTINFLRDKLLGGGAKHICVAAFIFKYNTYWSTSWEFDNIRYCINTEGEYDFVVGYGLDYHNKGRNLKELYSKI